MKKNIFVRVLAALGGVTLGALGLCALAETFFQIPVTGAIGQLLGARTPLAVLMALVMAILLCAFGVCCLMMLSSKRAVKRTGFVMQKGENGVIGVSVKSIEGLVQTCVKQHDVVERAEIAVVERRDGIVILLNIQEAAGVNIPLAVGALQKQIKQYVTTCTGVDVREVRVMVENTETCAVASPYAVKEPVVMTTAVTAAEMQREADAAEAKVTPVAVAVTEEEPIEIEAPAPNAGLDTSTIPTAPLMELMPAEEEAQPEEEAVPSAPLPQAVPVVMPAMADYPEEEDDRPLHQRIFGTEEQPVFVPAPPELMAQPAEEEAAEEIPAEAEEIVEEIPAAEEIAANAVLEVVEAIAEEEALQEDALPEAAEFEYDEEALAEEALLDGADEEEIPE